MSKAFRCDRCNRFEDDDPVAKVTFSTKRTGGTSATVDATSDLCSPCLARSHFTE